MNLFVEEETKTLQTKLEESLTFIDHINKFDKKLAKEFDARIGELNKLVAIMEDHHEIVNEGKRPVLFSQLSYGNRKAIEGVAWALHLKANAVKKERQSRGLAWHSNFFDYVNEMDARGIKVKETDTARNMYVDIDPDVVKAREEVAIAEAILEQFTGLKFEFIQGQSVLKAMYYGNRDTLNSTASAAMFGD
jgi:hypothetical protein